MAPDAVATVTLQIQVNSATTGTITNTTAVTGYVPDPTLLNNTDVETTSVGLMPDLEPTKYAPTGWALNPLTWTITIDNLGPSDAWDVVLTDTLTGDIVSYGSISTTQGNCSLWNGIGATRTFTCALGGVTAQLPARVTLVVTPALWAGTLTNTVTVTDTLFDSHDPDPTNNTSTDTTPVSDIDLAVGKTVNTTDTLFAGDIVVYTITIVNNGPISATDVVVSDMLPDGLAHESDDSGGTYDAATGVWNVVISPMSLTVGSSVMPHITATVSAASQILTNTATLSDSTPIDIIYYNNTGTVTITIAATAVGGLTKLVSTPTLLWLWITLIATVSVAAVVVVAVFRRRTACH